MNTKNYTLPEIRIKDAWLLRQNASQHLHELWGKGRPLTSDEQMKQRVGEYQKAWQPLELKILTGMYDALGLTFRQNIIDVYIAPWFRAFSDPMVIGIRQEPDRFIDILTHELLHRLLTDNTTIPYSTKLLPEWEKLFGKQNSSVALIHIPVHAAYQAICLDVLGAPERYERDIQKCHEHGATAYIEAWNYVQKHDYKEIVSQLKQSYAALQQREKS